VNKKFKSFLSLVLAVTMLVSTLTVTPAMAAGYSNDTNAPVLTISPAPATGNNLTRVSAGSTITVSAQNASNITYWWDSNKAQTRSGSQLSITVPNGTGTHRLNIEASNGSSSTGWRNYDYQVVSGGYNTNNITLTPAPGPVATGTTIRISGGYNLTYGWEYESQYNGNGSISYSGIGVKKLLVSNGNETYTYTYYFTEDTTAPRNLQVAQTSNVAAGSRLSVSASDSNNIASIEYMWDGDSYTSKGMKINGGWQVQVPNTTGSKTLYLLAKDDSRFHNQTRWNAFTVNVGYNGNNNNNYDNGYDDNYYNGNAPTLNVSPNSGNVNPNQSINADMYDNDGDLYRVTYRWDNNPETTRNISGSNASLYFTVPSSYGTHTLYITVIDRAGNTTNRTYTFYVPNNNGGYNDDYYDDDYNNDYNNNYDNTKPTIEADPDPSEKYYLAPGERIQFTSRDNQSGITAVAYAWDNDQYTEIPVNGSNSYTKTLYAPTRPGTHNLWLAAKNGAGIKNEWVQKTYCVTTEDEDDFAAPEIEVDPDGGKVEPEEEIEIEATDDDDDVYSITAYWEDEDGKEVEDSKVYEKDDELTIEAPEDEGEYTLIVIAVDEKGHRTEDEFDFEVTDDTEVYPGDPSYRGDVNPDVEGLRVEIRNATDKLKFEPKEDIKYYIDYYNAERTTADDVEIVMDLPNGFKAVKASDDGKITTGKVTWKIGDLKGHKGGRLTVTVEYTKDIDEATKFTMPAEIFSDSKSKDESEVFNMIYEKGAEGDGSHHAYVIGYPDGSFRPEGNITRAEMAAMLVKLFKLGNSPSYSRFSDVPADHWAAGVINTCVNKGLIDAYGSRFEPEAPATRAMFAVALARQLGVDDIEPIYINSNDTKNHYAMKEIEQLIRLGLIDGYRGGSVKPDNYITRAEAVTMLNKYAFRGGLELNGRYNAGSFGYNYTGYNPYIFNDLTGGHWAIDQILEAALNHSYTMTTDGNELCK